MHGTFLDWECSTGLQLLDLHSGAFLGQDSSHPWNDDFDLIFCLLLPFGPPLLTRALLVPTLGSCPGSCPAYKREGGHSWFGMMTQVVQRLDFLDRHFQLSDKLLFGLSSEPFREKLYVGGGLSAFFPKGGSCQGISTGEMKFPSSWEQSPLGQYLCSWKASQNALIWKIIQ